MLFRCNALGAEYVDKDQHWRGIYFLQKASAMAPGRMEPLINLAVAYAELGLYRKANDYFAEAVKIDPAYGPLLANLRIFSRAGLLDEKILSGLAPGGLGDSALPAAPPPGKGK
ncbi:MAG: hypothetical protein OEV91_06680 [Desulfobulbaceae bacterium]|nr:hypothetical protein [Desulfobulbaceae bacterium]HIJ91728.1 hypothetical protein [Deltaproteobacteria bacterium]